MPSCDVHFFIHLSIPWRLLLLSISALYYYYFFLFFSFLCINFMTEGFISSSIETRTLRRTFVFRRFDYIKIMIADLLMDFRFCLTIQWFNVTHRQWVIRHFHSFNFDRDTMFRVWKHFKALSLLLRWCLDFCFLFFFFAEYMHHQQ